MRTQPPTRTGFGTPSCAGSCEGYELTTDLDLASVTSFEPIGDASDKFDATFNGNGYTISNLLSVSVDANDVGMFGKAGRNAVIRNLGLVNVSVTNTSAHPGATTGALVGRTEQSRLIIGCYVTGTVKGSGRVGGLVGYNEAAMLACYSQAEVVGEDVADRARLGGLVRI